jgi:pimeloyl-ACP methyl ester carboxylesterase
MRDRLWLGCVLLLLWGVCGAEGNYVDANGLRVYYQEAGTGPALLLLHGGSLTSQSWQWLMPKAAQYFRVIAMDTRGHGRSNNPSGEFSYRLLADDAASVIRALDLDRPIICGYSDGGATALMLAVHYPDLVSAVIVGGATHKLGESSRYFDGMRAFFVFDDRGGIAVDQMQRIAAERGAMVERWRQWHTPAGDTEYWRTLLREAWPMWTRPLGITVEQLARVEVPALIVLGDRDEFFAVEEAVELAGLLPNAELAIAPGAYHALFRDKSELFNALVLDFAIRQIQ